MTSARLALALLLAGCGGSSVGADGALSDAALPELDGGAPEGGALPDPDGGEPDAGHGHGECGAITCPVDPLRERVDYRGIWGAADDAIWVVGGSGQIRFFDGVRWTAQESGTTAPLLSVHGTARDDVWAVGQYGALLHYDGTAWTSFDVGGTEMLIDVAAVSRTDAWVLGGEGLSSGLLLHWDGTAWAPDPGAPTIRGARALDASAARVVVLQRDRVLSRDAGAWTEGSIIFEPYDVALVGDELLVLKRDFGYVSAADLEFFSEATHNPYRLAARSLDRLAIVGERGRIHDRGDGEDRHREHTQHDLHAVWIAPGGTVWAAGDAGTIIRAEPTRMRTVDAGDQRTMLAVHARASDDVWAAGLAGNVLHFDGSGWSFVESGTDTDLRAIVALADGSVWAGGDEGVAVRIDGTTAERHDLGVADAEIRALVGDEGVALWAAGTTLHHWDGAAWTEVATPTYVARDAWSPGPGDVWLAEEQGHVQRFVDGVEQPVMDIGGGEHATAIWGTSAMSVYVARRQPSMTRWDGTSWVGVPTPKIFGLDEWTSIFGTSDDDVMAVGRTAVVHDGTEWREVNAGATLLDVHGVGDERWAVGWNEELRYGVLE